MPNTQTPSIAAGPVFHPTQQHGRIFIAAIGRTLQPGLCPAGVREGTDPLGQHHTGKELGTGQALLRRLQHPAECLDIVARSPTARGKAMCQVELGLGQAGHGGTPVPEYGTRRIVREAGQPMIERRTQVELSPTVPRLGTCHQICARARRAFRCTRSAHPYRGQEHN